MTNYNEYLEFDNGEFKEKQEKILSKIVIDVETTNKIKSMSEPKNLLIFAEPHCPDCRTLVAIVERLRTINPTNINIEYKSRVGNEAMLNSMSDEARIPTVFLIDGIKVARIISEFPESVKELFKENGREQVIYDYRTGKYNDYVIKTLVKALTR